MKIAHAPAGYIVSTLLYSRFIQSKVSYNLFIFWGMVGAIVPEFDFLYHYTIDQEKHNHHEYFTHFPLFWLCLLPISVVWLTLANNHSQNAALAFIFTINGFIHMILDSINGDFLLFWLAPFSFITFYIDPYIPWNDAVLEFFTILWAVYLWKKNYINQVLS